MIPPSVEIASQSEGHAHGREGGILIAFAAVAGCFVLFGGFNAAFKSPLAAEMMILPPLGKFGGIYVPLGIVHVLTRTTFNEFLLYFGQFLIPFCVYVLFLFVGYALNLKGKQKFLLVCFLL